MKVILSVFKEMLKSPVKTIMTLIIVGIGAGVLILSLSISSFFEDQVLGNLNENGSIVYFANGEFSDSGSLEQERPPIFDENLLQILPLDIQGLTGVSPVSDSFWSEIKAEGVSYQVRYAAGVSPEYFDIMNLETVIGQPFTWDNYNDADKVAVLTETTAIMIYGTVENALNSQFSPPAMTLRRRNSEESTPIVDVYTVVGVVEDPSEVTRKSYGTADIMYPATAAVPPMMNAVMAQGFLLARSVISVDDSNYETIEAQLRSSIEREYGDGITPVTLSVWEGTESGPSDYLSETRKTVQTFSMVVNLLGILLLITGSIGILSIMIVEILGKNREIAVHRALGANRKNIVKEFFLRSLIYSFIGALIGLLLSFIFSNSLLNLLLPLLTDVENSQLNGILNIKSILIGIFATLITGGILGTLPIFNAVKSTISEAIREG